MSKAIPYQIPKYNMQAFNCPHCHAFSSMSWGAGVAKWYGGGANNVENVDYAYCTNCKRWSIWYEEEMIYPRDISIDPPNDDLPEEVIQDYKEAALILQDSPRGAAALLRLAIQKLCDELVEGKDDLNHKIGTLVEGGLDSKIQKALDIVRVIGSEGVHPGQIDLKDSPEIANQLFRLVNLIGQRMITEPAEVDAMYETLPPEKRQGIEDRDTKNSKPTSESSTDITNDTNK
jgi:hypothetical protein